MQMSVKSCRADDFSLIHFCAVLVFVVVFITFNRNGTNDIGFIYRCTFLRYLNSFNALPFSMLWRFLCSPKVWVAQCLCPVLFLHGNFIQHWKQLENVIRNRRIFAIFLSYSQCARLKRIGHHLSTEWASQPASKYKDEGKTEYGDSNDESKERTVIECTEFDCKSLFSVSCKNRNAERNSFPIC